MRRIIMPIVLVALVDLAGCTPVSETSPETTLTLVREQHAQIEVMSDRVSQLQKELTNQHNNTHPATVPIIVQERRYVMYAGLMRGNNPNLECVYLIERKSGRMVVMVFLSPTDRLQVIAGRDISEDATSVTRRSRAGGVQTGPAMSSQTPVIEDGSGSLTVLCGENEHCLFVIDQAKETLLIYRFDVGRKRLDLAHSEDLLKIFNLP